MANSLFDFESTPQEPSYPSPAKQSAFAANNPGTRRPRRTSKTSKVSFEEPTATTATTVVPEVEEGPTFVNPDFQHQVNQFAPRSPSDSSIEVDWLSFGIGAMALGTIVGILVGVNWLFGSPNAENSSVVDTSDIPTETTTPTTQDTVEAQPVSVISQDAALELVQEWFNKKPLIFGESKQGNLLNELLAGERLEQSRQSFTNLVENDHYYDYLFINEPSLVEFVAQGDEAEITVAVDETFIVLSHSGSLIREGSTQEEWVYRIKDTENGLRIVNAESKF
jgi:hypothetical protein